jgi:glycogen operon protein
MSRASRTAAPTEMTGRVGPGTPEPLGLTLVAGGANIAVHSADAVAIDLCVFDAEEDRELRRIPLRHRTGDTWHAFVEGLAPGTRYGLRAHGAWSPADGLLFNSAKLLLDPYARAIDRPFRLHPAHHTLRANGQRNDDDSAAVMPKAIAVPPLPPMTHAFPDVPWGRTICYELHPRGYTMQLPDVPSSRRGTIGALGTPAAIQHLVSLGVTTVELLPVMAWVDEPHLVRAGLTNYWGYNTIGWCVPDPRLAPGGIAELREAVAALHAAGIEVLMDVVYNHSAEGDANGLTLSLRGLDNRGYYRLAHGRYVNDSGCGNTLALDRPATVRLVMDSLRYFVDAAGIDGFRFDLATDLGRRANGFDPAAPLLAAIEQDPVLRQRKLIAEPWDIGPGGYQLGQFPARWGEWNDRYRDTVRRFWRGDGGLLGELATRVAGSADVFAGRHRAPSRSVNFITAHDGFTLHDLVSYSQKHNLANGESNRDGTDANYSWNHGVEGPSSDPAIIEARQRDVRGLLALLLLSRGTPMLTMGDELGRTQQGNNNAYAQDNPLTWVDWGSADRALIGFTRQVIALRQRLEAFHAERWLTGRTVTGAPHPDVAWRRLDGTPMAPSDWTAADGRSLVAVLAAEPSSAPTVRRVALVIHGGATVATALLPAPDAGCHWTVALDSAVPTRAERLVPSPGASRWPLAAQPRSLVVLTEDPAETVHAQ